MHHLDIRFKSRTNDRYSFSFHKLHKSWRRGKAPPVLHFYAYPEDKSLCVGTVLDENITRTKAWRSEVKTQLLLGMIKPHVEVKSSTVSGWLKRTAINESSAGRF